MSGKQRQELVFFLIILSSTCEFNWLILYRFHGTFDQNKNTFDCLISDIVTEKNMSQFEMIRKYAFKNLLPYTIYAAKENN